LEKLFIDNKDTSFRLEIELPRIRELAVFGRVLYMERPRDILAFLSGHRFKADVCL
jgi:hypothetical protein